MSKSMNSEKSRRMLVLYGSQTGTAEDIAERIRRDAIRRRIDISVSSLDDYQLANLVNEDVAVFCVSTTGQGDPPDNMKKFWNLIWRKSLPPGCLAGLKYAVIGFGDSSYLKFNFVAKKLDKRLQMLGAESLLDIGLADEQHDYGSSGVVEPWLSSLWQTLEPLYPLTAGLEVIPDTVLLPSRYKVEFIENLQQQCDIENSGDKKIAGSILSETSSDELTGMSPSESNPYYASLISNERVTAVDHWQDVRLITFDITNSNMRDEKLEKFSHVKTYLKLANYSISMLRNRYMPGDVLVVKPKNSIESVEEFLELLNIDPDACILVSCESAEFEWGKNNFASLVPKKITDMSAFVISFLMLDALPEIPKPCTARHLVENYLDISSLPKRYFWELLANFTDSEIEREKLWEFCTPGGQEDLHDYCTRPRRNILEVMKDFPHATSHIPFEYLFEMIGPLRPRQFSIASSQLVNADQVQLLVAVVRYRTKLKKVRLGVCSNYLASLVPGSSRVAVWVQKGTMYFPGVTDEPNLSPHSALIMVGPGTGCAPFRSCIQQRAHRDVKGNVLFFGCRNREKDFLCMNEWQCLQDDKYLTLHVAFSRDQVDKDYVQHSLARQSSSVWDLIKNHNAFFYIAGNAKNMPDQVRDALKTVLKNEGKFSEEQAEAFIFKMISEKRYQCETWS